MTVGAFQFMCALMDAQQINLNAVYRVHWLKAKAQKTRWIKELQCLQVEMESTVRFFQHQEQFWQEKQEAIIGPLAHSLCQKVRIRSFGLDLNAFHGMHVCVHMTLLLKHSDLEGNVGW